MKLKRLKQMQTSRNRTRATKVSILLLKCVKTQLKLICSFSILQSQTFEYYVRRFGRRFGQSFNRRLLKIVGKEIIEYMSLPKLK